MIKRATTILAVLALAAAVGLAWWLQNRPSSTAGPGHAAVGAGAPAPGSGARAPGGPGAGAAGGGGGAAGGAGPVAVEVGTVEKRRLVDEATAVGALRSHQSVTLRPEVSGRIAALGFTDGQRVRRGQLVAQLDDALQRAQLQQAQAQAALARTQLQRQRELQAQGFVSASAVDQSAGALEVAEAQVALARAQLERMMIRAPFDGVAGIRRVDVGEYVKDGAEIVTLQDMSSMWVDFALPERYLGRVRAGQAVQVQVDALGARRFDGRVEALDARVEADGRSLQVRARLDDAAGVLKAGMFARVRTVLAVREDALVVPEEALVPEAGRQYLVKVVEGPQGKVSQRLEARTGVREAGRIEVLQGLAEGDLVVVAGQERAMRADGTPLRIVRVGGRDAGAVQEQPAAAGPASAAARGSSRPAPSAATGAPA